MSAMFVFPSYMFFEISFMNHAWRMLMSTLGILIKVLISNFAIKSYVIIANTKVKICISKFQDIISTNRFLNQYP